MATKNCICKCEGCGVMFKPKKADRLKYCSRQCAFSNMEKIHSQRKNINNEKYLLLKISKQNHRHLYSLNVLREKRLLLNIADKNKRTHDSAAGSKTYKRCGCCKSLFVFKIKTGRHPKYCDKCFSFVVNKTKRKNARIVKAKRRAIERGAFAERIDPIKVFERDKWRCHICNTKTSKALRGTYKANAPELDHIVTLADGGSHTYNNVACACRACNMRKGAKSLGQLFLFGEGAG